MGPSDPMSLLDEAMGPATWRSQALPPTHGEHGPFPPPPLAVLLPLVDEADALIRSLFACGFSTASVLGRRDVSVELSDRLTTLIGTLDQAVRDIRHALDPNEAA